MSARTIFPRTRLDKMRWSWLRARGFLARIFRNTEKLPGRLHLCDFVKVAPPTWKAPCGVNLVGYLKSEIGLGESCRILASGLEAAGESLALLNIDLPGRRNQETGFNKENLQGAAIYDVNILNIQPTELFFALKKLGLSALDGRYNIGFWLWELDEVPSFWRPAFGLFDEIWAPSDFVCQAIRRSTDLPVLNIPYFVTPLIAPSCDRRSFELPEGPFLFMVAADADSGPDRKNIMGAVEAYRRAFRSADDAVGLIVKIRNATDDFLNSLKSALKDYPNVHYFTETLDKPVFNALIKCADAFVSLHRSEGFGLVMAEAMALGTPVIATNWSSNTEFMTHDTACLVDCQRVEIGKDWGPYRKGQLWAEPDLDQASAYMRRLVADPDFTRRLAQAASQHLHDNFGQKQMAQKIRNRLDQIRSSSRMQI